MSRLMVVVSRGARLEGAVADAAHTEDDARVFTLRGQEVARVHPEERYVVRRLPHGRFPDIACGSTVAAAG